MSVKFPEADFYDCNETLSTLRHTSSKAALEYYVSEMSQQGGDIGTLIAKQDKHFVTCYRQKVITDEWIETQAQLLLEEAAQNFKKDFDTPGDPEPDMKDYAMQRSKRFMIDALQYFYSQGGVNSYEVVEKVELTPEQVTAVVKTSLPTWWEKHTIVPGEDK